jgi:chromatin structure-remodeling complex subunit RSC4
VDPRAPRALLIKLTTLSGEEIAAPFINKPDKTMYKAYYDIIQHPVSLRGIQKRARGIGSKNNPMKKTAFPTWKSYEDEMGYIWSNARAFNEDGSEISILAGKLEVIS